MMKVAELNGILLKLLPVLELYKEASVEDMLEDIYRRCKVEGAVAAGGRTSPDELNLLNMKKNELQEVGRQMGLKLSSSLKKMEMIERISLCNREVRSGQPVDTPASELEQLAQRLKTMRKEEIVNVLEACRKSEIQRIGAFLNLKIPGSIAKNNAILIIANHFAYLDVHRRMGEHIQQKRPFK